MYQQKGTKLYHPYQIELHKLNETTTPTKMKKQNENMQHFPKTH